MDNYDLARDLGNIHAYASTLEAGVTNVLTDVSRILRKLPEGTSAETLSAVAAAAASIEQAKLTLHAAVGKLSAALPCAVREG